jgi:2-polyprenyl-3-methyl-5-hydroxy-6-metoxy-1,4-benzoquinol methylase
VSAAPEPTDYFSNHRLKLRFPWSLYHRPIVQALEATFGSCLGPEVLNVGSGPFLELARVDARARRITIADIDERAIEAARKLHGDKLAGADVLALNAGLPYATDRFDLVVSMDVVEHLPEPALRPWLDEIFRVTKPGGSVFLTTPNYAPTSGLALLEGTALELIARAQGFSRKDLHPSKMTPERLRALLEACGWSRIHVEPISLGWVLAAHARKPHG